MEKMNFKVMLGVIPGYGHENNELTASNARSIGEKTWREAIKEVSSRQSDDENPESENLYSIDAKIISALAVYSKNFGCPTGGEVGIQVAASMAENQKQELYKKSVIETIKTTMSELSQSTATIEWSKGDKQNLGTTYISEGGKSVVENDSLSGIEKFSVALGNKTFSNEECVRVGSALQDAMELISSTPISEANLKEKYYMISGILTPIQDGNEGLEFSASQNPIYGQENNDLYKKSVIKTVEHVMKTLGQEDATINFEQEKVNLNLKEILAQKEIHEVNEK